MNLNKLLLLFVGIAVALTAACSSSTTKPQGDDTPTAAFKRLFEAVKSKNTDNIKKTVSKQTQAFAESMMQIQQKSADDMYKNGFLDATMGGALPEMRDERIKGNFGAVEVKSPNGTWQDAPFVLEDGEFKLAVGDVFNDTFKLEMPPKSASNANNMPMTPMTPPGGDPTKNANIKSVPMIPNMNANMNANSNTANKPANKK